MRRPPWWPEGEPFPPNRRWPGGPAHVLRLVGCLFVGALMLSLLFGIAAGAMFGREGGPHPFFAVPIVIAFGLVFIAAAAFRRATRPMDRLIDAARRIESGDYSTRVPESGPADMRSVARAFNAMSSRLKAVEEQRRGFMADVTHELRTPLSVIRGQAEAIVDGVYPADAAHLAPILDATSTLDRLVEDLRTLALTDAGSLVLHKEPTDLGSLVHDTVESFRPQAESAGVSLHSAVSGTAPVADVDPSRMRQVIGNLLSNAIRHTPVGGTVTAEVSAVDRDVTISVTDTGEGIPPDLLPHVFERFVKGPGSTGSGLGLAIAHDIVVAHGGAIVARPGSSGGTAVDVRLTRAAAHG